MPEYRKEGELLFKEGDWELRRAGPQHRNSQGDLISRLWHNCEGHWWYVWTSHPQCMRCKKPPPTELIGLKHLQDWDR